MKHFHDLLVFKYAITQLFSTSCHQVIQESMIYNYIFHFFRKKKAKTFFPQNILVADGHKTFVSSGTEQHLVK